MSALFGNRRQTTDTSETTEIPKPALASQPIGFDTVLGKNCTLEGKLVSSGNVRLDGTFIGTLEITGNILIGESAKIDADVQARNISIAGAVRGNVEGHKVQLLRTGRIWGDISASTLTTEEGAFIDGKITMIGHEATRQPEEGETFEALLNGETGNHDEPSEEESRDMNNDSQTEPSVDLFHDEFDESQDD